LAEHSLLGFPFEEYGRGRCAVLAFPFERRPLIALAWTSEFYDLDHLSAVWVEHPRPGLQGPSRFLVIEGPYRCDTNWNPLMPLARVQSRIDVFCSRRSVGDRSWRRTIHVRQGYRTPEVSRRSLPGAPKERYGDDFLWRTNIGRPEPFVDRHSPSSRLSCS